MKYLKIVLGVIATILLGALGSGLWERVFSPLIDSIFRSSIRLISSIYSGYLDGIYKRAATEISDLYQVKLALLIIIIVSIWILLSCIKHTRLVSGLLNRDDESLKKIVIRDLGVIGGAFFLIGFFFLSYTDYAHKIKSYSYQSLDIIRPAVGEQEYLELKSKYLQIKNVDDFKLFNSRIKSHAEKFSLILPDFEIIE